MVGWCSCLPIGPQWEQRRRKTGIERQVRFASVPQRCGSSASRAPLLALRPSSHVILHSGIHRSTIHRELASMVIWCPSRRGPACRVDSEALPTRGRPRDQPPHPALQCIGNCTRPGTRLPRRRPGHVAAQAGPAAPACPRSHLSSHSQPRTAARTYCRYPPPDVLCLAG